jgi:hypothetical protein
VGAWKSGKFLHLGVRCQKLQNISLCTLVVMARIRFFYPCGHSQFVGMMQHGFFEGEEFDGMSLCLLFSVNTSNSGA